MKKVSDTPQPITYVRFVIDITEARAFEEEARLREPEADVYCLWLDVGGHTLRLTLDQILEALAQ